MRQWGQSVLKKVQFYAAAQHTLVNEAQLLCFMVKSYGKTNGGY
jgi:hypothetical protein